MANFGKTWWGQQWLNSLNNIDYSNRLPRGSRYANKGAVTKITVKENQITAYVQGSRPKPYKAEIILPPFCEPELSEFINRVALKPVIISKMLNRELDAEVLSIAESTGLKVFPKQWSDFKMQCSCPDWAVPCKHLAAVVFKVCDEIDNNPFLVFNLHKADLIAELNKLGILVNKESAEIPVLSDLYFDAKAKKREDYNAENAYQKISFSALFSIREPLIALLSDSPPFYTGNGNFKEKYSAKLGKIVKAAQKITQGKVSLESAIFNASLKETGLNSHSHEEVVLNEEFHLKVSVNDKHFQAIDFMHQAAQVPPSKILDYQPSTAALHSVLHLAVHLVANGAVVPQIVQLKSKAFVIRWLPAMLCKEVRQLTEKLADIVPPGIFLLEEKNKMREINKQSELNLLSVFITEMINALDDKSGEETFLDLFFKKKKYAFNRPGEEALSGGINAWLQKYYLTQGKYKPMITAEELRNDNFKVSVHIEDNEQKLKTPIAMSEVLNKESCRSKRYDILQSLMQISNFIPGLDEHINSSGKKDIVMTAETFTPFLMQMIPAIQLLDISILLPKSLQNILRPKPSLKVKKKESRGLSLLRLDDLLDFDWQIALGDTLMNEAEFKKLLKQSDGLIKFKTNYIYVKKEELEKIYKHFSETKELNAFQLLRAALGGEYQGAKIALTEEVQALIDELTNFKEIPMPKGIVAELRPYQKRGYSWLYRNSRIGFGSVMADDMGLGKTLQVIAAIQKYKEDGLLGKQKVMVVAPTGLLSNWEAEMRKFAPSLTSKIYHGTNRKIDATDDFDVLITSYGVIRSDAKELKKRNWHSLIIDEAQNIKNSQTEQTKAIRTIPASNFIAMSGTPVENRLSELWSIMDYSNRGLLGSIKEFNDTYGNPIQLNNDFKTAEKLKKVTAPFLMRRLKTDKSIISDLPDKIEMDCFASLAKDQASLYEKTLQKAMQEIEGITLSDSKSLFVRQGLVLQMILALKQICNHPTQFLKNKAMDASLSGKMELLFDKLDSIADSNEKVLIFSQFTEMGGLLKHFIAERYKEEPLFYHGGSALKQRNEMVHNFQNNRADKIFILSLKAAGTGLNLTAANHVIHYDLWWNPAVEAQATDRAYRIGQKSNVMVHRFIVKNTFEERINEMIQQKKNLAEMTVATGENWIGNLSNTELKNIFSMT